MEQEKKLVPNGGYPMHTFEDLKALYFVYIKSEKGRKIVEDAYLLAKEKHAGVFRKSGEPYIQHPIEVAYILAQLEAGPATLASGLLHDTVEDTDLTIEEIRKRFGDDVALIVDSLTKIQRMKLSKRKETDFEAEDHRKIFLGMARDVRVILVKLADRLHNLRTLDSLSPERQKAIAKESLEVFTPIAHRLGIYTIQSEMEDLSLKYLEPEKYKTILDLLNQREANRQESLTSLKKRIADILFEHKIPFRMESRVKSIYSIYRKMYKKGYTFDEIYDVLAIRIITKTEMNCYEILGIIHATYKPIPGRFKDYIAMPKPNMYQSLHTTIVSGDGNIYEVQIRTEEMDKIAETGIAAHWRYKEGENYNPKEEQRDIEEKLHWFRDFVSMSGEGEKGSAEEFMAALSNDIFNANVYVFTPLGKVIELPTGATTLDFAYKIHTKVGDQAVGATVNGALVPLNTVLKTGDVCEIKTSKTSPGPNLGWLDIAKTSSAKAHIKKAIQKREASVESREALVRKGREWCLSVFEKEGIGPGEMDRLLGEERVLANFHVDSRDALYAMVAGKSPTPQGLLDFLNVKREKRAPKLLKGADKRSSSCPVVIDGGEGVMIGLAHCCTPIPGDHIVGFVSKGKGIIVHRANCPNVASSTRLLEARWRDDLGVATYPVDIEVYANDRANLLADILVMLSSKGIVCSDLKAHLIKENMNCIIAMTVFVPDAGTLDDVFTALKGVRGVYDGKRIIH